MPIRSLTTMHVSAAADASARHSHPIATKPSSPRIRSGARPKEPARHNWWRLSASPLIAGPLVQGQSAIFWNLAWAARTIWIGHAATDAVSCLAGPIAAQESDARLIAWVVVLFNNGGLWTVPSLVGRGLSWCLRSCSVPSRCGRGGNGGGRRSGQPPRARHGRAETIVAGSAM